MSTRKSKGKYNKRSSKDNNNNNQANGSNNNNKDDDLLTAIIYKYPGRFATLNRTILLNEHLTINEILTKVTLSTDCNPPEPKKVFEAYFFDEIHPFINKHAQETINSKKEIGKSWEQQHERFKRVYMKRSELLRNKWIEMKQNESSSSSHSNNKKDDNLSNNVKTYSVTNHHHHYQKYDKHKKTSSNGNDEAPLNAQTVIFKYYSVHSSAKTNRHIFITSPSKTEMLKKVNLSQRDNPISAKELFEIYYYDEILPFLKKSGQQSIRGKKDLAKVWQIQTKTFKGLYEDRARILLDEWQKQSKKNGKKSKKSSSRTQKMLVHSPKSLSPKNAMKVNVKKKAKISGLNKSNIVKTECSLIRTLLNFLLLIECGLKEDCFLLLVDNVNERYLEYRKFEKFVKENAKRLERDLKCLHLRVLIDKFESHSLRLHTSDKMIKLCFVHPIHCNEELVIFELRFEKLKICGLEQRIDHEKIVANLDDECRILAIEIPLLLNE